MKKIMTTDAPGAELLMAHTTADGETVMLRPYKALTAYVPDAVWHGAIFLGMIATLVHVDAWKTVTTMFA